MTITVLLEPAPEGGYNVTVPSLPEVVTEGETLKQAVRNAREAISLALLVRRDLGEPMPEDKPAPAPRPPVLARRLRAPIAVA